MADVVETPTGVFEISRRISSTDASVCIDYTISTRDGEAIDARLVERLPTDVDTGAVRVAAEGAGDWHRQDDDHVAFVGGFDRCDRIETSLQLQSDRYEPARIEPSPVVIELAGDTVDVRTNGGTEVVSNGHNGHSTRTGIQDDTGPDATDRRPPAIGVVVTQANVEAVVGVTMRATERDMEVIVGSTGRTDAVVLEALERLGATVLEVDADDAGVSALESALLATARGRSYPGLILASEPADGVDFEESIAAFRSTSVDVVDAVPEQSATTVMVGIPAYDEAATIRDVVEEGQAYADEVVVVDDGSTDQTATIARNAGATVVEHRRNLGYGNALQTLFEEASRHAVDCLIALDADQQHDPSDIPKMVRQLEGSDGAIVIGNRYGAGTDTEMPIYRRFGLAVINGLVNLSLGSGGSSDGVRDAQSGYRGYDRTAIESLAETDAIGDHMDASLDILYHAHRKNFDIVEVPTEIDYDVDNASSHNPFLHGIQLVSNVFERVEREHPTLTLGLPGIGLSAAGLVLAHLTFFDSPTTGQPPFLWSMLTGALLLTGFAVTTTYLFVRSLSVHARSFP